MEELLLEVLSSLSLEVVSQELEGHFMEILWEES